ncbi:hypothetical protein O3G_MSEX004014 [Manduca sexta]|uniref:Uncharacterized protein n=1 Tax=Manduca sexta TaxID=7130 RepID=A0A922CGZ8_MANSE|nr:hypothetical protein O3G_MSEX004014 [Manduca sexta]
MTSMTPKLYTLPRSFYDTHCADCDTVLGFVMKKTVLKLDPGLRQPKIMDNGIALPRQPLLEDFSVMFQNRPSAVATPPNKPNFAEAIKAIGTTITSKSP